MGNSITIQGTVESVGDTQQVSDKFRKRLMIITSPDAKYPQTYEITTTGDRCSLLDGFGEGDEVQLECNLKGRAWTSPSGQVKHFLSLEAWRVERVGAKRSAPPPAPTGPNGSGSDDDSLPF